MRCTNAFTWILISLLAAVPLAGQQAAAPQSPNLLLQRSVTVAGGGGEIRDVTLAGTARRIAGSTDETGQVELKALASGEARLDLTFPSGKTSEVVALGARGPVGEWTSEDGKAHTIAYHNLLVDAAWFCPTLVLGKMNRALPGQMVTAASALSSAGENRDRLHVERQPLSVAANLSGEAAEHLQRASRFDLDLDPATSLPAEMKFSAHPDNDISQEIPVRVVYSDYRSVNGAQIPFHVQKFLNNSLVLEIQLETASVNSGLTAAAFTVSDAASRRHQ